MTTLRRVYLPAVPLVRCDSVSTYTGRARPCRKHATWAYGKRRLCGSHAAQLALRLARARAER